MVDPFSGAIPVPAVRIAAVVSAGAGWKSIYIGRAMALRLETY